MECVCLKHAEGFRFKRVTSLRLSNFITYPSVGPLQSLCCQFVLCHLTQTSIDLLTSTLQQHNPAAHFTWHPQPLHSKCTLQSPLLSQPLCSPAFSWMAANDTGSVSDLHEQHLATPPPTFFVFTRSLSFLEFALPTAL